MKFYVLFFLFLLVGCTQKVKPKKEIKWSKENSMELNKTIALEEKLAIKLFLAQHTDWKIIESGTGLQYYIYTKTSGEQIKAGNVIDVECKVEKLDGTVCYKTEKDEVIEIEVDHSQIETGIQEGVKKMKVGERAKFIVPSHLAHGLTGDFDKIPPLTPLVIDIHVIEILK